MRLVAAAFALTLAAISFVAPGCASKPDLPPEAKTGLTSIQSALNTADDQLNNVVATLRKMDELRGDAPSLIAEYQRNFAALERTLESTRARMSSIRGPESFFAAWKADIESISDTQLRREGEDRFAAAQTALNSVNKQIDELRDSFAPLYQNMQDLSTYLKNDPTLAGLEKSGETIRRMLSQYRGVQSQFADVQRAITALL